MTAAEKKTSEKKKPRKKKSQSRAEYLNNSADLLCMAANDLCERSFGKKGDGAVEAKDLKEICSVLKEAITISESLEKREAVTNEGIKVYLLGETQEYAI